MTEETSQPRVIRNQEYIVIEDCRHIVIRSSVEVKIDLCIVSELANNLISRKGTTGNDWREDV
jgi:hypothetical protein